MNKSTTEIESTSEFVTKPMLGAVLSGMKVFKNDFACISKEWIQYKFPKSKKKRIRNKWSKMRKNFRMQEVHRCFYFDDKIFVSSKVYEKLIERSGHCT